MTGHAPTPDDFTLVAAIASPELRRSLALIAGLFASAEAECWPEQSGGGGAATNKPGSRPPGNTSGAKMVARVEREVLRVVTRLYREADPDARAATADFRRQVRIVKERERAETVAAVKRVYVADGRLRVKVADDAT